MTESNWNHYRTRWRQGRISDTKILDFARDYLKGGGNRNSVTSQMSDMAMSDAQVRNWFTQNDFETIRSDVE